MDVDDGCLAEAFADRHGDQCLIGAGCVLEVGGAANAAIRGGYGAEEGVGTPRLCRCRAEGVEEVVLDNGFVEVGLLKRFEGVSAVVEVEGVA